MSCGCEKPKAPCCNTKPVDEFNPCTGECKKALPFVHKKRPQTETFIVKRERHQPDNCKPPKQPCEMPQCVPPECKTICYKCPPKRDDCYPQDPRCYKLEFRTAFNDFDISTCGNKDWLYFNNGILDPEDPQSFIADDGKFFPNEGGEGLIINAKQYTKTYPGANWNGGEGPVINGLYDNFKFSAIFNSQYLVPECGQIYVEACAAAKVNPGQWREKYSEGIFSEKSDFRPAYASIIQAWNMSKSLLFEIGVTQDSVWAGYHRLPFKNENFSGNGSFAPFYSFKLMGKKPDACNSFDQFSKYGIGIDKAKQSVTYYINGVAQVVQTLVGLTPKPQNTVILFEGNTEGNTTKRDIVSFGFGLSSAISATLPVETAPAPSEAELSTGLCVLSTRPQLNPFLPSDETKKFTSFIVDSPTEINDRLFGQGASLSLKDFKIELRC